MPPPRGAHPENRPTGSRREGRKANRSGRIGGVRSDFLIVLANLRIGGEVLVDLREDGAHVRL